MVKTTKNTKKYQKVQKWQKVPKVLIYTKKLEKIWKSPKIVKTIKNTKKYQKVIEKSTKKSENVQNWSKLPKMRCSFKCDKEVFWNFKNSKIRNPNRNIMNAPHESSCNRYSTVHTEKNKKVIIE